MYMSYRNGTFEGEERYEKIIFSSTESGLNTYFIYESQCAVFTLLECQPFQTQIRNDFRQECSLAAIIMSRVKISK